MPKITRLGNAESSSRDTDLAVEIKSSISSVKHSSPMSIPTKQISPSDLKSRPVKGAIGSESGSETCASYETLDSRSSSLGKHSNGSEFGESMGQDELTHKLPAVQAEIAQILKLDVSHQTFSFRFIDGNSGKACFAIFLKDPSILEGKISILSVSVGTILCREGDYVSLV